MTERIAAASARAGRKADEVTLVVVTKERSVRSIVHLYELGHRHFGENRAQELAAKAPQLPPDIVWHFVGPLQSNKARVVRPVVSLLHSFDRADLIGAWAKGSGYPPPVLIQVKIGGEVTKQGVDPNDTLALVEKTKTGGIEVVGLMAIPPPAAKPDDARPGFEELARLGRRVRDSFPEAKHLSMGMSDDFEVAIESGATIVRVGRAIFEDLPN